VLFRRELVQGMLALYVVEAARICSMCKGGVHGCSNSCGFDSCWHGGCKCSGGRDWQDEESGGERWWLLVRSMADSGGLLLDEGA